MNVLLWVLIVIAIIVAIMGLYALIRHRQRSGDVFASRPVSDGRSS